ncbi:anthranilate phosphoribosyltransferase [Planococcus lenghuensis]|uniref:Anthranilate phosphoribosyltransferase n=1 Tax=Planococcus lenghuensis TaxID=2213202 RepID=A0A1Q2L0M6_9BACL|nr:anthranilate phosphoribosyltransferase [Planococcus lenghuensis]AQQ53989.1 anthranilate phosphoribosyltransferase [Planococcus lenghuensis]
MREYTAQVNSGSILSEDEMRQAGQQMLAEETKPEEIREFLIALHTRGEAAPEIAGLVGELLSRTANIDAGDYELMDVCGTGGDKSHSFNISTAVAFVLASLDVKVAKHGNRSVSSKAGSSDLLEAIGVDVNVAAERFNEVIEETGLAFLFAPAIHPAIGRLRDVRKSIDTPTIFNLAGPLANPIPVTYQVTGVYRKDKMRPMAEALVKLGRKRGAVLHGAGGMDELSLAGDNHVILFDENGLTDMIIHPHDVGLNVQPIEALRGGDAQRNAEIFRELIAGKESAYQDVVALNAGLALYVAGRVSCVAEGVKEAKRSLSSGRVEAVYRKLVAQEVSQ